LASLYEVPLGGGEAVKPFSFDTSIQSYEWAPDGQSLALVASDPGAEEMQTDLPYQPEMQSLAFGGGTYAFVTDAPEHPREIYVLEAGSDTPRRLTDHNPWLSGELLAEQEVVTYTARDGQELQGLLIYPLNKEEGTRYPLITVVHGGPEAHYDDAWLTAYSMAGQMAAARGYAVFYPNYRGSTGRGVEFAMSSQGDLAGAEFDDIINGVDALIDRGRVDEDRVGVTGGSYGGYATAWMSTR